MNESQDLTDIIFKAYNQMDSAFERLHVQDKTGFLEAAPSHYATLMETEGQEKVLRNIAQVFALNNRKDESVSNKAEEILKGVIDMPGLDESLTEECPVCETRSFSFYECLTCGFSFIEDYRCPLLDEGRRICRANKRECSLFGTEFEACPTFNGD